MNQGQKKKTSHILFSVESKGTDCTLAVVLETASQLTGHIVNDDGYGGVSDVARDQAAEPLLPSCVPARSQTKLSLSLKPKFIRFEQVLSAYDRRKGKTRTP